MDDSNPGVAGPFVMLIDYATDSVDLAGQVAVVRPGIDERVNEGRFALSIRADRETDNTRSVGDLAETLMVKKIQATIPIRIATIPTCGPAVNMGLD